MLAQATSLSARIMQKACKYNTKLTELEFFGVSAYSLRIVSWTDGARSGQRAIWDVGRLRLIGGPEGSQVVNILV